MIKSFIKSESQGLLFDKQFDLEGSELFVLSEGEDGILGFEAVRTVLPLNQQHLVSLVLLVLASVCVQYGSHLVPVDEVPEPARIPQLCGSLVDVYLLGQEGKVSFLDRLFDQLSLTQNFVSAFPLLIGLDFNHLHSPILLVTRFPLNRLFLYHLLLELGHSDSQPLRLPLDMSFEDSVFLDEPPGVLLDGCFVAELGAFVVVVGPADQFVLAKVLRLFRAQLVLLPLFLDDVLHVVFYILSDYPGLLLWRVLLVFSRESEFLHFELDEKPEESFELRVVQYHFEDILKAVHILIVELVLLEVFLDGAHQQLLQILPALHVHSFIIRCQAD